jgi:hypothetical protein
MTNLSLDSSCMMQDRVSFKLYSGTYSEDLALNPTELGEI